MSVTNAISGIIVVGALLQIGHGDQGNGTAITALAFIAILLASINVFGGFAVTRRMLAMFSAAGRCPPRNWNGFHVHPRKRCLGRLRRRGPAVHLALAGLAKHETSRAGNTFGITGMAVALIATIARWRSSARIEPLGLGLLIEAR